MTSHASPRNLRWLLPLVLTAPLLAVTSTTPASASPLVQSTCLVPGGTAPCAESGPLTRPQAVLVTDIAVYVAADDTGDGPGIVVFARSATTGALTRSSCLAESGVSLCSDGHGLGAAGEGPSGLAMNAAGTRLYAVSRGSDAVAVVLRDPSTGTLTQASGLTGCISNTGSGGCTDGRGLVDKSRIALSADGQSLYVSGGGAGASDGGLAWIKVANDGTLSQDNNTTACFQQVADAECTPMAAAGQLVGGTGVVVSPDGTNVYAGGFGSSSLITFSRSGSGSLTQTGCLKASANAGCTTVPELLAEVAGLRFASNSALWVTVRNVNNGFAHGRVQRFNRDTGTGQLTLAPTACVTPTTSSDSCSGHSDLLFTANDIVFSADGKDAYVAANEIGAVTAYDVTSAGALTPVPGASGCFKAAGGSGCSTLNGVDGPVALGISPDSRFVYAVSQPGVAPTKSGIAVFRRNLGPPQCTNQTVTVRPGQPTRLPLSCSDPDGDPLSHVIVTGPSFGQLGAVDQTTGTAVFDPGQRVGEVTIVHQATGGGQTSGPATLRVRVEAERVAAKVSGKFDPGRKTTSVKSLKIRGVPDQGKVEVRCVPKKGQPSSCSFGKIKIKVVKGNAVATSKLKGKQLGVGAVLQVWVTAPSMVGQVAQYTVRAGKAPKPSTLCLPVGGTKPVSCGAV